MNTRKIVIGAVLVIIGLPVVLVLVAAVAFHVLDRTNGTIVSSGQEREYLLYVPRSYDRAKPTPLVISGVPPVSWTGKHWAAYAALAQYSRSQLTGDTRPSEECRRRGLYQASMQSKIAHDGLSVDLLIPFASAVISVAADAMIRYGYSVEDVVPYLLELLGVEQ